MEYIRPGGIIFLLKELEDEYKRYHLKLIGNYWVILNFLYRFQIRSTHVRCNQCGDMLTINTLTTRKVEERKGEIEREIKNC